MTAPSIHSPASAAPGDENAAGNSPAQPSSGEPETSLTVDELRKLNSLIEAFYRVCDLCGEHGWPKNGPVYPWLEQRLAELDRYRVAAAERDENKRLSEIHDSNEG